MITSHARHATSHPSPRGRRRQNAHPSSHRGPDRAELYALLAVAAAAILAAFLVAAYLFST